MNYCTLAQSCYQYTVEGLRKYWAAGKFRDKAMGTGNYVSRILFPLIGNQNQPQKQVNNTPVLDIEIEKAKAAAGKQKYRYAQILDRVTDC